MIRSLTWAVALIAAIGAGGMWFAWSRASDLAQARGAEIDKLRAEAEAQEAALEAHRDHVLRLQAQEAAQRKLISDLSDMEGADAPLSDFLGRAAERLWP